MNVDTPRTARLAVLALCLVLLLVAALTTGIPGPGRPVPAVAWGLAAAISLTGSALFMRRDQDGRRSTEFSVRHVDSGY